MDPVITFDNVAKNDGGGELLTGVPPDVAPGSCRSRTGIGGRGARRPRVVQPLAFLAPHLAAKRVLGDLA